jgi:chromosome segregation ATPase
MRKSEEKLLKQVLENLPEKADMKFKYGINKNITALNAAMKDLEKTEKQAREILAEYDKEAEKARNEKIMEWGEDTENGGKAIKPKSKNWAKWLEWSNTFFEELNKKYEKEIKEYEDKLEEMKPLYEQESDFKPFKVSIDVCPDMPRSVLAVLMDYGIIE